MTDCTGGALEADGITVGMKRSAAGDKPRQSYPVVTATETTPRAGEAGEWIEYRDFSPRVCQHYQECRTVRLQWGAMEPLGLGTVKPLGELLHIGFAWPRYRTISRIRCRRVLHGNDVRYDGFPSSAEDDQNYADHHERDADKAPMIVNERKKPSKRQAAPTVRICSPCPIMRRSLR